MPHQCCNMHRKDTCSARCPALGLGTAVQSNSKNLLATKIFQVQFNRGLESLWAVDKVSDTHVHGSPGRFRTLTPGCPALNPERAVLPPKRVCTRALTYY